MKTRNKIYSLALTGIAVMLFGSCQKFLDIPRTNTQVLIETPEHCQLILDNYDVMNTGYPFDGNLSSDDYYVNDAEYKLLDVEDQELYKWNGTILRSSTQYTSVYNKVYSANLVLEAVEKISKNGGANQAVLDRLRGSALFFRAFCFWQVAQLYAKPYGANSNSDPGIPLRLTSDINEKSVRGTVQQTYDKIVQDLKEATNLLTYPSIKASRPDKAAAYAMLARVYLSMEDYAQAGSNANSALQLKSIQAGGALMDYNSSAVDQTSETPFQRLNAEVIFHAITRENNTVNPNLWGMYYARIVPEIVDMYDANDLRRSIFLKPNFDGGYRFTGNYEPTIQSSFFNGLATDEMYLIRAESYARAGNFNLAMQDINDLLVTRYTTGTYVNQSASTELAALNIILAERKKELLMRGLRWTDLRRLNKDSRFAKTISRKLDGTGATIATLPANDLRYTLLLPRNVIDQGGIAQNER